MASQKEIDISYNYLSDILRLTYGEHFDYSCAMYNGDFSLSLEEAQAKKHSYILDNLGIQPGQRILDVGCGWGPMLSAAREAGAEAVGITLSSGQVEVCRGNGFDVHLQDWKDMSVDTFGGFDGIVSVGSFEHYCSIEEYRRGKQDEIYRRFFQLCHDLLPAGGRMYLQTMMWGEKAPPLEEISVKQPKGSDGYIVAVLSKFYPGSWLPFGEEHIIRTASPLFRVVSLNNGRADYLETMKQWGRVWEFSLPKLWAALKMGVNFFKDRDFGYKLEEVWNGYQRRCFERNIIDHQRIVLERAPATFSSA